MSGYTPLYDNLLTGTLYGKWPHVGVWACLLSRVSREGVIDERPEMLAAMMGIEVSVLLECIHDFMEPDPGSRTSVNQGRRLTSLDPDRDWGWRVVNHSKYKEKARKSNYDQNRTDSGEDAQRKRASRDVPTRPDASRDVPLSSPTPTPTPTPTHTDASDSETGHHKAFESLKTSYPKFAGRQDWIHAEHYCRNRIDDGETWFTLKAAVERYAKFCDSVGKTGTNFVLSPGKFFSAADEPWKQPWDPPVKKNNGTRHTEPPRKAREFGS